MGVYSTACTGVAAMNAEKAKRGSKAVKRMKVSLKPLCGVQPDWLA
jgi:hypothetical protein